MWTVQAPFWAMHSTTVTSPVSCGDIEPTVTMVDEDLLKRRFIEVPAYQRQYSFDRKSVSGISSLWGGIEGRNDINKNWVMGINSNLIYMRAFGISEMRKLLNNIRNGK